ncbi:MAG: PAS domain S-box protein [Myxococcales bacterium]|nr:PAS domain S-box protein [Myxococcales bacterium]
MTTGDERERDEPSARLAARLRASATGRDEEEAALLRDAAAQLESIAAERDRLRATLDRALVGIFRTSLADGRILYSNQRNAELLGYDSPEDSIQGMRTSQSAYVYPEERDEMRRRLVERGHVERFRTAVYCKDNSVKHVVFSARLYPELGFLEGTMADDSERVARERELERLGEALREQNAELRAHNDAIARLSAPVIELDEHVLCVPMIGALSPERFRALTEKLLAAIVAKQARVVMLELTGAQLVGPETAAQFVTLARATRLLGSRVVLAGMRPELARALVETDAALGDLETCATLRDGLARLRRAG